MRLAFYLHFHTHYGESLWISGNFRQPGSQAGLERFPMEYVNQELWKWELEIPEDDAAGREISYSFLFRKKDGDFISEGAQERDLLLSEGTSVLKIYDYWNDPGEFGNVFYTAPFQKVLLPVPPAGNMPEDNTATHIFRVKAPLLNKDEVVCLLGDIPLLGNWDTANPLLMKFSGQWWELSLNLRQLTFPVAYKYGIYNQKTQVFVSFEAGGNRICYEPAAEKQQIILQDGYIRVGYDNWKGAGVSVPVFSLRTERSFGIGEFTDLRLLVDWAKKTGLKLIQLLPVNDTTATGTWHDSYPYAAISAFALHPVYVNLEEVAGKKCHKLVEGLRKKQKQLNAKPVVAYEEVLRTKLAVLREIFDECGPACLETSAYKNFFDANREWLRPYAVFCHLRDKFGTADFSAWNSHGVYDENLVDQLFEQQSERIREIDFYCLIQYHLHTQLSEAVSYAHKKGIILKGDIPIGVYRYGCDTWVSPGLFKMNWQAGAPPDDFATYGQNWSFPTYNWENMKANGFRWWKSRFAQMSNYFDAFRIDHILGFFRIWSIPLNAVQGIMGRFDPCLPVHQHEFGEKGIWFNYERFCKPFISEEVVNRVFGDAAPYVRDTFLQKHTPGYFELRPDFDNQRKIAKWFADKDSNEQELRIRKGLFDLISNVILFEEEGSDRKLFHFRIGIDQTLSFQLLPAHIRERLWDLYIDYFYKRQNEFWRKAAMEKLPCLKAATNMLICGEDLGMVPEAVPEVMARLGILSLEIQRMPKNSDREFVNLAEVPYLAVVTPSTHDMSTIRGWWQENRRVTQKFYHSILGQSGEAPFFCEPWINRAIVLQHLYAPAMWSIFQIQDLLGMSATLRREKPEEERINIPADPNHYWCYRMHITLEHLLEQKDFNEEVKGYVRSSGR